MNPKAGDIFKFPVNSKEFAFGRILLDIKTQCVKTKKINQDNPLIAFPKAILVEVYAQITTGEIPQKKEILIPGILTSSSFFKIKKWEIVDFEKVDYTKIDFPETLSSEKAERGLLVKGELKIPFEMEFEELEELGMEPCTQPCIIFGELVLYQLGKKDEINNPRLVDKELRNLANDDLRFSKHRKRILKLAGIDPKESYYDLSKRMGHDLSRFYEADEKKSKKKSKK